MRMTKALKVVAFFFLVMGADFERVACVEVPNASVWAVLPFVIEPE